MAQHVSYTANDHVCALGTVFHGWGPEFEGCLLEEIPQLTINKCYSLTSVHLQFTALIVVLYIKGKGAESEGGSVHGGREEQARSLCCLSLKFAVNIKLL